MRDIERLDKFYDELKQIHKEYFPDWRFGQLCGNFFGWLLNKKKVDSFFTEEEEMIKYVKEYTKLIGKQAFAIWNIN